MLKKRPFAFLCSAVVFQQLTRTLALLSVQRPVARHFYSLSSVVKPSHQSRQPSPFCHFATARQVEQDAKTDSSKQWYLYMIRCGSSSKHDDGSSSSLYTGITTDVERRFQQHVAQSSKTAKYLRGKGPLELVFVGDAGPNRSQASKLEHAVKKLPKVRKEALVRGEIRLETLWKSIHKEDDTTNDSIGNKKNIAPIYITIGPPCSGKTEALRSHLFSVGYNPDDIFDRDVALGNQGGVYHRIPLESFLFPSTKLDTVVGSQYLHGNTTVRDRLCDPAFFATDQEMRNVLWRVAGRLTPREFATRCQAEQARRAMGNLRYNNNDFDPYVASMRRALAHDLARATEEVAMQAVAEVICELEFDVNDETQSAPDLPDIKEKRNSEIPDRHTINATQANLLSARKLIGTSWIDLFVPQALFQRGIPRAKEYLSNMLTSSRSDQPVSWGNTNTRPTEYAAALAAAEEVGRPVEFIVWGTQRFPALSRQELFRRSVSRLRRTGRYIPAGVIEASLGRVHSLLMEVQRESDILFPESSANDDNEDDDIALRKLSVALASLAGFYMDDHGFVTHVDEPKHIPKHLRVRSDLKQIKAQ